MWAVLASVAQRMMHREIFMALDAFRHGVSEAWRKRNAAARVLAMWKNRVLTPAFLQWHGFVRHIKSQRVALARTVRRWANQKLAGAFFKWKGWVDEIKSMRLALSRTVRRWTNQKLAGAFFKWTESTWSDGVELLKQEIARLQVAIFHQTFILEEM